MLFRQLSIGRRLATVLSLVLGLSLAGADFALWQLHRLAQEIETMTEKNLQVKRLASDWYVNTSNGIQRASAIAKSMDESLIEFFAGDTAEAIKATNVIQKRMEALLDTSAEKELYEKIGGHRKDYLSAREAINKAKKAGDAEGALAFLASASYPRPRPMSRPYAAWWAPSGTSSMSKYALPRPYATVPACY